MKIPHILFCLFLSFSVFAQRTIKPTDQFTISGEIKNEKVVTLSDLGKFPAKKIKDIVITNQKGEPRDTAKDLSVVALKDILADIEFKFEKPKELNRFYLVFTASDGYKAVFSWNEIFNNETGNNIYVIIKKGRKKIDALEDRIQVIVPTDFKTGRRYIRGLDKIVVKREG